MDGDTRRDLGGLLAGSLALLLGLALRLSDVMAIAAIGAAFAVGGGLVVLITGMKIATRLMRSPSA